MNLLGEKESNNQTKPTNRYTNPKPKMPKVEKEGRESDANNQTKQQWYGSLDVPFERNQRSSNNNKSFFIYFAKASLVGENCPRST